MSNRYRANRDIGNKVVQLGERASKLAKKTSDPHLSADGVQGSNIADSSVDAPAFAPDSVSGNAIGRGAVGTENMGVVNTLKVDSNLWINTPGVVKVDGIWHPITGGTYKPIVQHWDGHLRQGGVIHFGHVDPYWTYGLPKVTLDETGAVVQTIGWNGDMVKPTPGGAVVVERHEDGWYIVDTPVTISNAAISASLVPFMSSVFEDYSNQWQEPSASKSPDGIVSLTGMVTPVSGTLTAHTLITTLPSGWRPDHDMRFPVTGVNNETYAILVQKNGAVWYLNGVPDLSAGQYLSLAGVRYPVVGVATWTTVAAAGTPTVAAYASGWSAASAGVDDPPVSYWKDPYGLVWWRGSITPSANVLVDNTNMILYNSQPLKPTDELHFMSMRGGLVPQGVGTNNASNALRFKTTSTMTAGDRVYLDGLVVPSVAADSLLSWNSVTFGGGWSNYGAGFSSAQWANRNSIIVHRGLIKTGSLGAGAYTLPVGARPDGAEDEYLTGYSNEYATIATNAFGKVQISGNGQVIPAVGGTTWFSLDGLMTLAEH